MMRPWKQISKLHDPPASVRCQESVCAQTVSSVKNPFSVAVTQLKLGVNKRRAIPPRVILRCDAHSITKLSNPVYDAINYLEA